MSYNTQDISAAAGQPVELYRFVLGQQVWTVTSGREAITYQVESYQPAVIRRSAVEQSPEFARNGIDLECARDFAVAQLFAAARPNGVGSLTVFRNHLGDSEYITWWKGRVASVGFAGFRHRHIEIPRRGGGRLWRLRRKQHADDRGDDPDRDLYPHGVALRRWNPRRRGSWQESRGTRRS